MGTSAGPSLQGIGRGGDSNLVLEMDAHDAKSYPGEPTTNLIPYYSGRNPALVASVFSAEALWTSNANSTDVIAPDGSSTTTKAVTGTTGNSYLYRYMDATFGVTIATSTTYTISVWMKQVSFSSANVALVFQDRGNGSYGGSTKTVTQEWKRVSYTITTGAGATSNTLVGLQSPTNSCTFYFWGWQVEQKGYPTPYVVSQLLDPSAQGPSSRPASVNLMIHASSSNAGVNAFGVNGGQSGWTGWTLAGAAATSTDYTYNGPTSIKCVSLSQTMQSPTFSTVSGKIYRVSYWAYCSTDTTGGAGNEHSELYVYDGNGTSAVYNPTWPSVTLGSWIHVTRTFTSSVTGSSAYMKIHPDDNETIYFADVVVEDADQIIMDSSPSKHTLTVNGEVTNSAAQSKFSGGSIYFPSADYLNVTSSDFAFGTISWTVDFWMNQYTTLGWASPVDTYGVAGNGFILGFDGSTNYLAFYSEGGVGWQNAYGSHAGTSFALTNGTWYHVAYVRDGNAFTCYVNGAVYFTATLSASDNYTSTGLYMGRRGNMNGSYEGYLDEVRVCRGTALWTSAFTPPTRRNLSAPVVDRVNDNGLNCTSAATTDTATYRVGEVIRPIDSAVWDFDGTDDKLFGGVENFDTTGPGTLNLWFNPDSGNAGITTCFGNASASDRYFNIHPSSTSLMRMGVVSSGGWQYKTFTDNLLDTWAMLTIVNTGSSASPSTYSVYLNGTSHADNPVTYTGSFSNPTDLFVLGNYTLNDGYDTLGQIANVQMYKVALTAQQIVENFNQQRNRFNI